jgi:hypothetical protein
MLNKIVSDKRGWIKVVEAFFAVVLIGAVLILVIEGNAESDGDISSGIYKDELAMLRAVQLNDSLRASVLGISDASLPLSLNDLEFPSDVRAKTEEKKPSYLICNAKICEIDQECAIENAADANIYVSKATIFANLTVYNPRKIVLSCALSE